MTQIEELFPVVKEKYQTVKSIVVTNAVEAWPKAEKFLPKKKGELWEPAKQANLRWVLLNSGFTYREYQDINRKLNLSVKEAPEYVKIQPPTDQDAWIDFVLAATTPKLYGVVLRLPELKQIKQQLENRLSGPVLSVHEKTVLKLGDRLQAILAGKSSEEQERIVAYLANTIEVKPPIVWRVATGNAKITAIHLGRLQRAIFEYETDNMSPEQLVVTEDGDLVLPQDYNED